MLNDDKSNIFEVFLDKSDLQDLSKEKLLEFVYKIISYSPAN